MGISILVNYPKLAEATDRDSLRSQYIHSYSDYFFLGPLIEKDNLDFELISTEDNQKRYAFKTNIAYSLGVNLNLFDVNLRVSFSTSLATQSKSLYGSSDVKDIQLTAITRRWFADGFYQEFGGFYIDSSNADIPSGQPYPQRADIITSNYGVSFAYIFNHQKFSLKAPYIFGERQKVSKGSFLLNYVLSSFAMKADSALITQNQRSGWGSGSDVTQLRFTSLGIGPGYSHTFVMNKFFLNLTLVVGPAHYWIQYKEESDVVHQDIRIDGYSVGRVGLGYNGDRFFAGLSVNTQSRNIRFEEVTLQNGMATFRLVTGYRFREAGFLKRRAVELIQPRS